MSVGISGRSATATAAARKRLATTESPKLAIFTAFSPVFLLLPCALRVSLQHGVLVRRAQYAATAQQEGPPIGPMMAFDGHGDGRDHDFVRLEVAPRPHLDKRTTLDDKGARCTEGRGGPDQHRHGRGRRERRDGHLHAVIEVKV